MKMQFHANVSALYGARNRGKNRVKDNQKLVVIEREDQPRREMNLTLTTLVWQLNSGHECDGNPQSSQEYPLAHPYRFPYRVIYQVIEAENLVMLAAELDALLPALLDRAFQGEL